MQAFLHFQVSVQVQGRRYAALNVLRTALSRLTGMTQVQWQSINSSITFTLFCRRPRRAAASGSGSGSGGGSTRGIGSPRSPQGSASSQSINQCVRRDVWLVYVHAKEEDTNSKPVSR